MSDYAYLILYQFINLVHVKVHAKEIVKRTMNARYFGLKILEKSKYC